LQKIPAPAPRLAAVVAIAPEFVAACSCCATIATIDWFILGSSDVAPVSDVVCGRGARKMRCFFLIRV